jgi:hypothetical protein
VTPEARFVTALAAGRITEREKDGFIRGWNSADKAILATKKKARDARKKAQMAAEKAAAQGAKDNE